MLIFKKLLKSKIFLGVVAAAIIIIVGSFYIASRRGNSATSIQVIRGTIVQDVTVTGKTKSAQDVNLAFERSGRIIRVAASIGDRVVTGQILAVIDQSALAAELLQNQASIQGEQAKLDQLKRGTRPEEIKIQEAKVANAVASVADAKNSLADVIQESFTKSDDAVRNKVDQFLTNGRTSSPQINFQMSDPALELTIKQGRVSIENTLNAWSPLLLRGAYEKDELNINAKIAEGNLRQIRSFLDATSLALSSLGPTPTITQTTINGWKSDVSTARTNINTAISNLATAEEKLRSAESDLTIAENELALDRAGSTIEDIAAQEATLRQVQAKVAATEAELAKTILRSPINGIVTKQDAKVGEIIPANTPLVSVISESDYEIEANVPEVDIGKLALGNPVAITLDAFPNESFHGRVVHIDPAETIIDGVVNFKVTILFDNSDPRMKSGLTANLSIETLKKENVLVVRQFAVIENDQGTFVRKLIDGKETDIPITIGIRGEDGNVEIISGLQEGDTVLNIGIKQQ
jgi:HlyD family secretion protein